MAKPVSQEWAVEHVETSRGWLRGFRNTIAPEAVPNSFLYAIIPEIVGFVPITQPGKKLPDSLQDKRSLVFLRVHLGLSQAQIAFSKMKKDSAGHAYDMLLQCQWQIDDADRFLQNHPLKPMDMVKSGISLSKRMVDSWLADALLQRVHRALDNHGNLTLEQLRDRDALPAHWWEQQFNRWLQNVGILVSVPAAPRWVSEDAKRAEAEVRRKADLERVAREREAALQARLREERIQTEHDAALQEIELDRRMNDQERERRTAVLKRKYEADLLAAQKEQETLRHQLEESALQHELRMAELANDLDAVQNARQREERAEERHEEVMDRLSILDELESHLDARLNAFLDKLKEAQNQHQAMEEAVYQHGIPPEVLARLGFPILYQAFLDVLLEKERNDKAVQIVLPKITTRDADALDVHTKETRAIPVDSISIGSSLGFEFVAARSGYVSLINLGTSGNVWLNIPSAYVHPEEARVVRNNRYQIPGDDRLLPYEDLERNGLYYGEGGPVGWEHLAVIVSDAPLFERDMSNRANARCPFIRFGKEDVNELLDYLTASPSKWTAGVLSFLVVNERG